MKYFYCCIIFLSFTAVATAQNDSVYYDLGRVKLRKDFTQGITIKGKDLEKIPFISLSEAVKTWFFGELTNPIELVYVIDGNLTTDVNSYSIYDIAEITLIQNAVGQLNGATENQHLVVITTNWSQPNRQGVMISGQAARVTRKYKDNPYKEEEGSEANVFHQYAVSGHRNSGKVGYGLSANYLRDVNPSVDNEYITTHTPSNIDRLRLNGFFQIHLGKANLLKLNANFTNQAYDSKAYNYVRFFLDDTVFWYGQDYESDEYRSSKLFSTDIRFTTQIVKGLKNSFSIAYSNYTDNFNQQRIQYWIEKDYDIFVSNYSNSDEILKSDNLSFQNHLTYTKRLGNWSFEPSLNFSLRIANNEFKKDSTNYTSPDRSRISGIGQSYFKRYYKTQLLTPSLSIFYKSSFNIQAGLVADLSDNIEDGEKENFPFITLTADLVRIFDQDSPVGWKIYGSYAESKDFEEYIFPLYDLKNPKSYIREFSKPIGHWYLITWDSVLHKKTLDKNPSEYHFLGTSLDLFQKVEITYNYNRKKWEVFMKIEVPGGTSNSSITQIVEAEAANHRFGISSDVIDNASFRWHTHLSYTFMKNEYTFNNGLKSTEKRTYREAWHKNIPHHPFERVYYDHMDYKQPYNVAWSNRFAFNKIAIGIDIKGLFRQSYLMRENQLDDISYEERFHTFSIQNAFVSYYTFLNSSMDLEIYLTARNIALNDPPIIGIDRKYVGIGFKLGI